MKAAQTNVLVLGKVVYGRKNINICVAIPIHPHVTLHSPLSRYSEVCCCDCNVAFCPAHRMVIEWGDSKLIQVQGGSGQARGSGKLHGFLPTVFATSFVAT